MNKNVIVTGGASGIGRAIVAYVKQQGDTPIVIDCLAPDHEAVTLLKAQNIVYLRADVSSGDSVKEAFSCIDRIDVLVNNAGIARDGLALRLSESDWDTVLAVNLKGAFLCSQQALKRMIRQDKSYIINISSIVGLHGNPGQANYAASKAGLIALTKTLAQEYASRNIMVNAIAPGFIKTPMTERLSLEVQENILARIALKRFGTPEDIAYLISFLISGHADYITGQVISLDGGMF